MEETPDKIQELILQKLQPYKDRIAELENSLQEKENEAAILRLAAQRLSDIVKKGAKGGSSPGGRRARGGAASGKPARRGGRVFCRIFV